MLRPLHLLPAALLVTLVGCKGGEPCPAKEVPAAWARLGTKMVPPGASVCSGTDTEIKLELRGKPAEHIDISSHFESQGWVRKGQRISDLGIAQFDLKKGEDFLVVAINPSNEKRAITEARLSLRKAN